MKKIAIIGLGYVGLPLANSNKQFLEPDYKKLLNGDIAVIFDIGGMYCLRRLWMEDCN